jgi:hypothetical protein
MKLRPFMLPLLVISICCTPHITQCMESDPQGLTILSKDVREEVLHAFMIEGLEKAAHLIAQLDKRGIFPKLCARIASTVCTVFDNDTIFEHEEITRCKELIEQTKSLQPFIELWAGMQKNLPHLTLPYLREIAILILKIYKAIYTACSPVVSAIGSATKNLALQAIALLFSNIASLQAFELLNIIEKLTVQIPKLLEKYEITTGTLTWKEWIIKYWWLPPMAIAAIVLEGAFIYQVATGAKKMPALKSAMRLFSKENKEAECEP